MSDIRNEQIADALNELFQIDGLWNDTDELISSDLKADQFRESLGVFIDTLDKRDLALVISSLSRLHFVKQFPITTSDYFRSLNLRPDERRAFCDFALLRNVIDGLSEREYERLRSRGNRSEIEDWQRRILGKEDLLLHLRMMDSTSFDLELVESLFEDFCQFEMDLLKQAGLNQRSVAIVMQFLKKRKSRIVRNLMDNKVAGYKATTAKLDKLQEKAKKENFETARRSRPTLKRLKYWTVGAGASWANALPVVLYQDWGVASVFSAVAGSTLMAVLPAGDGEDD